MEIMKNYSMKNYYIDIMNVYHDAIYSLNIARKCFLEDRLEIEDKSFYEDLDDTETKEGLQAIDLEISLINEKLEDITENKNSYK